MINIYFYIAWWVYKSTVSIVPIARCSAQLRMRHLIMTHSFVKGAVGSNTAIRATYAALLLSPPALFELPPTPQR